MAEFRRNAAAESKLTSRLPRRRELVRPDDHADGIQTAEGAGVLDLHAAIRNDLAGRGASTPGGLFVE
jgi:hypothetical protein